MHFYFYKHNNIIALKQSLILYWLYINAVSALYRIFKDLF